ncbi:unnamed protein product, partial [Ascophyllum nodosum]
KPLIRRDKGDTLSLLVQFLLKLRVPCVPHFFASPLLGIKSQKCVTSFSTVLV